MSNLIQLDVQGGAAGEGILDNAAFPGMHLVLQPDGNLDPGRGVKGAEFPMILREDFLQGRGQEDAYALGERGFWFGPELGDRFNVLLEDGESITRGTGMRPQANGKFVPEAGQNYQALEDATASGSDVLVPVRYVSSSLVTTIIKANIIGDYNPLEVTTMDATNDSDPIGSIANDSSGPGGTFTATLTERPLLRTGANGINGNNAMESDGVNDFLSAGDDPAWEENDMSVYVILERASTGTQMGFFGLQHNINASEAGYLGRVKTDTYEWKFVEPVNVFKGFTFTETLAASTPTLLSFIKDGISNNLFIDGVLATKAGGLDPIAGNVDFTSTTTKETLLMALMSDPGAPTHIRFYAGLMGRIAMYSIGHNTADRKCNENFLAQQWGTPAIP